jgi:hypothetical protein
MNKMLLSFLFFVLAINPCYSQADNIVETITIGSGNTIENAKFNALRMALEQVSGSYLSANTLVINDKLISDNISSIVSSGSIESYNLIEKIKK